ncbi:DUF4856 domain-containing protein [Polaribacter glomeratus]|uniref:DUF4856 domain-containing protein n=1 Tax=Polaribacter glomeratus TaxID=102 RepID=A0A2S7WWN4_9FLAO|nr:DUF4856 domain-containing protein [Polaribacter glomeratus]PQJ82014.1 DUF4856 domain-containing protein [Polaribacter glomeratus]TXD66607.1 DUF4856 domain-containing protein [Polaribacter glomeratus]
MKKVLLSLSIVTLLMSCNNTTEEINTIAPATYNFERNGTSSVSFDGQTTRIKMGDEFAKSLSKSSTETLASLNGKFDHTAGENNFENAALNMSSKNIRSKVAASTDFFSSNSTDAAAIKADFDFWISAQVNEVFPKWNDVASAGNAGQIQEAGGGAIRYVNAKGLEYNQAIVKGLIGGLMVDQILNNYLSTSVLDEATNIADNDGNVLESGKNYTAMEHKWDEAFGYLYGNEVDAAAPVLNMDNFLNKYLARVEADLDFVEISKEIYNAFKLGRAAIVAKDYITRDAQAEILREKISEIVAIRAVYYLQQGKNNLQTDKGGAFHDLSEGFGFIYSLQFTRKPNSNAPYFTKTEVDGFINTLMTGNGFWDVSSTTLDEMANTITAKFKFTVAQAGS